MTDHELDLTPDLGPRLRVLDELIEGPLRSQLDGAIAAARRMLSTAEEPFGWHFIEVGSTQTPDPIRSGGVFVLPAGSAPPGHRHPNSTQHMRVLSGRAAVTLRSTEGDDPSEYFVGGDRLWLVIPEDVQHELVVPPDDDLVVVSFHTVLQEDLLEVSQAGERTYANPDGADA